MTIADNIFTGLTELGQDVSGQQVKIFKLEHKLSNILPARP